MKLYRGLSKTRGQDIVAGREQIAATSNGEFGNGSYYWREDLAAGIISALQYYGQQESGWAVLEVTVDNEAVIRQGITAGSCLNFRPNVNKPGDYAAGVYDKDTDTVKRSLSVPQFGDNWSVKVNYNEFREINADPAGHGLTGVKNTLTWDQYAIILGPTVACPSDFMLTQVKFQGKGLDLLNAAPKQIVLSGCKLNDTTFAKVLNWQLKDRADIYSRYFAGKTTVDLII